MSHQPHSIAKNFSCHAWNNDRSKVALSPNNEEVLIFDTNGAPEEMKKWNQPEHKLQKHGSFVSAIDWHPKTNNIVTSGFDRNAYVWKYDSKTKKWSPALVILRINRAATSVRWSPNGEKFGVTSGAKCVPICHFEESNNWWISKMIKKHKSTVVCLAWSPDNLFIVTGSTDFKCRIFSAVVTDADTKKLSEGSDYEWAHQDEFGKCLVEFDQAKAWVQGVAWSPDGHNIAFVGHGSSTHFVALDDSNIKDSQVETIYSKDLPNLNIEFMTDTIAVTAGYDMNPHLYEKKNGEWNFIKKLDPEVEEVAKKSKSNTAAARSKFGKMDKHGQSKKKKSTIKTYHKNAIVDFIKINDSTFSTCGLDGRILIWNL